MNRSDSGISVYHGDSPQSEPRFGQYTTCELCENERHCTGRFGMQTCRHCQRTLLP